MNPRWSRIMVDDAIVNGADAIFQVGDFGFCFDHYFLKPLKEAPMPVYWIPGNHDNYDFLESSGAYNGEDEMLELWPNIWHVPRVHVWDWDGRKFAACGGAYSVDQDSRRQYLDYWAQETINTRDYDNAVERSTKVDVFFSHDVPSGTPYMEEMLGLMKGSVRHWHEIASASNRLMLRKIVEQFGPELLIHGHMHHYYDDMLNIPDNEDNPFPGDIRILGLNCDEQDNSIALLDTDDLSVRIVR
jgi:calcineurin-like phosphoesterase family protein